MEDEKKKREERTVYYYLALYSGLGFTIIIFTIICMFLGIYLDKKLGTGANFSLGLTIIGMGIGGWWSYRRIIKNALEVDEIEEKEKKTGDSNYEIDD